MHVCFVLIAELKFKSLQDYLLIYLLTKDLCFPFGSKKSDKPIYRMPLPISKLAFTKKIIKILKTLSKVCHS